MATPSDSDPTYQLLNDFLSLHVPSLDVSFDLLVKSGPSDSDQKDAVQRAMTLGSALLEAGRRWDRVFATQHNFVAWPLPSDITIKILSMTDSQSNCFAAATSCYFRKCAEDPGTYANIDLVTESPKFNDMVVCTLIQRAGNLLRSLRLGTMPRPLALVRGSHPLALWNSSDAFGLSDHRSPSILTRACLASLIGGSPLKRLHLYNIDTIDSASLDKALSACPAIDELVIVCSRVDLRPTLESVSQHCALIEHLDLQSSSAGSDESLKRGTCRELVSKCPNLSFLGLKGFKLSDANVRVLLQSLRKLKYVDFSTSETITGSFLRKLGTSALEVIILRDCMHLKDVEVSHLLASVVVGEFRLLKRLDISNRRGLASEGGHNRCYSNSFVPAGFFERRPGFRLVAEFPIEVFSHEDPTEPYPVFMRV